MAVVVVLGAGMMGSAIAFPLADRGHEVLLVGTPLDGAIVERIARDRVHPGLGVTLPDGVRALPIEALAAAVARADLVCLGVSSASFDWAAERIAPLARAELPLFVITKGLAWDGDRLRALPDVLRERLPPGVRERVAPASVCGPCIAGELARRVPSAVVLAGRDPEANERIAALVRTSYYHVFPTTDVVGATACAALKNAYAMGVAFAAGLHERAGGVPGPVAMHNHESAVFAQAMLEMALLVERLGGRRDTVLGLAGVGDLDVTNSGGRTGRFGQLLGLGLSSAEAVARMQPATLECLEILASVRQALGVMRARGEMREGELPLFEHLAAVALDGAPVDVPFGRFFGGEP
jgi:glycerol-3-phosphate dehydrogenase (NAD(P)+)